MGDDLDSGDWTDFIDELHCVDYWYDLDEIQGLCDTHDDPYFEEDDEDYYGEVCGAD